MPSEFHLFSELPLELRLMIWREASYFPRVVKLNMLIVRVDPDFRFTSTSPPPQVLHANHESRQEGLRVFKVIHDYVSVRHTLSPIQPYFYVSPDDSVSLVVEDADNSFVPHVLKGPRRTRTQRVIKEFFDETGIEISRVQFVQIITASNDSASIREVSLYLLSLPALRGMTIAQLMPHFPITYGWRIPSPFWWWKRVILNYIDYLKATSRYKAYLPEAQLGAEPNFQQAMQKVAAMVLEYDSNFAYFVTVRFPYPEESAV